MIFTQYNFTKTLSHIGLSANQSTVYLTLWQLGEATAYKIAQACTVKKATVYVVLEELRTKGLVLKIPHTKRTLYTARSLNEYLDEQDEHLSNARSAARQLHTLQTIHHPKVLFFTGIQGIQDSVNYRFDSMVGKAYHSFYGNLKGVDQKILRIYDTWDRRVVKEGVSTKVIAPTEHNEQYYTTTAKLAEQYPEQIQLKFLKEYNYPPDTSFEIADDFVRIISAKAMHATIIDNKNTADAFREIFKSVWEFGR